MKTIPLTQGKIALVDDADYDWLKRFKWYANKSPHTYYVVRNIPISGSKHQTTIRMHRVIMSVPNGLEIDHINSNGLDNRRSNLRVCNHIENARHQKPNHRNRTGLKGVSIKKGNKSNPYFARICINYRQIHLGYYQTRRDAAQAYDAAALKHFGRFALTNEMLGLL